MTQEWLPRALEESRARGFLGPGAIEPQIMHAEGFAICWEERFLSPPKSFLDLGSGGGLPGLVLLERWGCRGVLIDSMTKRIDFLSEVLGWPDSPGSGEVLLGRSESIARIPEFIESFDLVTARSFGPPAVTAECGAPFLKIGGALIISEPPDDEDVGRWSQPGLEILGMVSKGRIRHGAAYQVLIKTKETPPEFPRSIGVPRKRPLF